MGYAKNILFGLLIGVANAIPGVSGGTMAVILNIYDRIMYSISLKNIRENIKFLLLLALGAATGIFLLSNVIVSALNNYPVVLNFCFLGLIVGSLPALFRRAKGEHLKKRNWIFFITATLLMIILAIINPDAVTNKTIDEFGGISLWFCGWLFITAAIGTVSMILPGLSGSLILLLLGTYAACMEAIKTFNLLLISVISLGVLCGGLLGVKVIKKMLRFHPQALYFGIIGLMVGSIAVIWPGFTFDLQGLLAVIGLLFFAGAAYFLSGRE